MIRKYTTAASLTYEDTRLRKLAGSPNPDFPIEHTGSRDDGQFDVYKICGVQVTLPTNRRVQDPPWLIEMEADDQRAFDEALSCLTEFIGFRITEHENGRKD